MKPVVARGLIAYGVLCAQFGAADGLAAEAGAVVFARGEVMAERTPPVALAKGDAVMDNDTIATGEASRAQIELNDGAKIAIRPSSRLRIDEYVFAGEQGPAGQAVSTSGDRSVATLLKGGFRTITGAIGKEEETAYEVRTAVGVLGIRGTDYSAVFCRADCDWAPGVGPNAPIEDGLYLGVTAGAIVFRNEIANIELAAGEYAFIPLSDRRPERLDAPPPVLLDDNDLRFDGSGTVGQALRPGGDADTPIGFDSRLGTRREPGSSAPSAPGGEPGEQPGLPKQPIDAIDADGQPVDLTNGQAPQSTGNRTIGFSTGPLARTATTWSGTLDNKAAEYRLGTGNVLAGFSGPYPSATGGITPAAIDIGTAANVETGFDSVTVLRWGRWSGGIAGVLPSDGVPDSIDLGSQSLHWVSGPEATAPPVLPITGTASYTLIGATSPTDTAGNTGVLGNATLFADFTNQRVDSTLTIDINATTWTAAGSGSIGAAAQLPDYLFSGNYAVTVGGATGGSGVFSGFFSAPGNVSDPAFPGGAALTYSLQDIGGTTTVSGAAVFGNP